MALLSRKTLLNPTFWVLMISIAVLFYGMMVFPLTDPSEARYAEIARKMLETGDWITPQFDYGIPFWAKPPLSTWLAAFSMKLFGVSEFAARIPSFILGVLTVLLTVNFCRGTFQTAAQQMVAIVLPTMGMFYLCSAAVMTDATLLFVCTFSLVAFWNAVENSSKAWGFTFFAAMGLALLAKGPAAWVLILLPIFFWLFWAKRWGAMWNSLPWFRGSLITACISFPWYILAEHKTPGFLEYFIVGEHIKRFLVPAWTGDLYGHAHQEPLGTVWVFLTADAFPWLLIALAAFIYLMCKRRSDVKSAAHDTKTKYLLCWFFGQMLFFTFAKNIIPTYALTALPALAVLIVKLLEPLAVDNEKIKKWFYACGLVTPLILLAVILLQPYRPDLTQSSARQISAIYPHDQQLPEKPMLYVGKRYFSMEFYRHGKVVRYSSLEAAIEYGKQHDIGLLVIADARLPGFKPETLKSITLIKSIPKFGIYKLEK